MKTTTMPFAVCALAALATGFALGCAPAGAEARPPAAAASSTGPPAEPAAPPRLSGRIEDSVWWYHMGARAGATACFGPALVDASGRLVRIWTVTCLRPGTPSPLGCLQGVVPVESADPVKLDGGAYALELRPRDGLTWGAVRAQDDVTADVRGID